jgi:hypothetical protein
VIQFHVLEQAGWEALMRLINYDKYKRKWSPRSTILLAVFEALIAGLFIGVSFMEAIRGRDFLNLGFSAPFGVF